MSLINELRSNYRLRVGLALIIGIVWLSWLLDLRDQNSVLFDQYKQTASQVARYSVQQKQTQWLTHEREAKAALAVAEERIWQNSSLGLTQAEMQDWLSQQLQQAKAAKYLVKISESENGLGRDKKNDKSDGAPSDLINVKAKLEFNTDPQALNKLLIALSATAHQIVVESMTARQPRTELTVSAWYKQAAAPVSVSASPVVAR